MLFIGAVFLFSLAQANIIFDHTPLRCDPKAIGHVDGLTGCLRGQTCTPQGKCETNNTGLPKWEPKQEDVLNPKVFVTSQEPVLAVPTNLATQKPPNIKVLVAGAGTPTTNGSCGAAFGGTTCAGWPKGECCSRYNSCGNTTAHCGTGCQSGPCVSTPVQSGAPTTDGTCGSTHGGTTCVGWSKGECCSSYGFCGNTAQHCGAGCQSGPCTSTGSPATTNGTCGPSNGGTTCAGWPKGECCSMYGFCGNTTSHCGKGCQSGPCSSAPVVPAPGASAAPANTNPGSLAVVGRTGVPAMHAALMENGRVIFLDKVENYTELKLPNGHYAYSSEYDPATNLVVPLSYKTNAFCSGGAFLPDGRLVSLGGNAPLTSLDNTVGDGFTAIRYLSRSATDASLNGQAWSEPGNKLSSARWYASGQTMPDGTIFVASGSLNGASPSNPANNNPTWELLSATGVSNGRAVPMDILANNQPIYMYPFIHLMRDGNLFVFVSKSSQSFNVASNQTLKTFPDLGGDYRTYPNTGGSVLLPLSSATSWNPDVMVCGGGVYQDITSPTDPSCGRIKPLSTNPTWEMDSMPEGRGMVEGTLLPDGSVIWLNGCGMGAQGFGLAKNPTQTVLIYQPDQPLGKRWTTGPTSTIARLYHSVAVLLLDGTLMVAGSNPVSQPVLTPVPNQKPSQDYVTEFRVEIYTPPYLSGANANKRPTGVALSTKTLSAGGTFTVSFTAPAGNQAVKVSLYHGGLVTHSLHMGHRMAFLDNTGFTAGATAQTVTVTMPPSSNIVPPGPYVVYVVVDGVPAVGQFVKVA